MDLDENSASQQTVLVTGGSGYVGSWVATTLLQKGYWVRATLRNLDREPEMRSAIAKQVASTEQLSFVQADLLADAGWAKAVEGCAFVMHVASAMGVADNIRPAREGTARVLKASAEAGVKRVVLTSSAAAASPAKSYVGVIDEQVWTNPDDPEVSDYGRAKTLAEQDAWAFMSRLSDGMSLTTILPVFIQGPVLGPDYSQSIDVVARMLKGAMPAVPRIGFNVIDVRDLADLHVSAMTAPAAAGQRFIATSEFLWLADIARLLRENLGEQGTKAPTRRLPDLVLRLSALFSGEARFMVPSLGRRPELTSAKAHDLLGWQARPAAESVLDTAQSLIREGLI